MFVQIEGQEIDATKYYQAQLAFNYNVTYDLVSVV